MAVVYRRGFGSMWVWEEETGELAWLQRHLARHRPDVVVFCFEAVSIIPHLAVDGRTVAMVGFLPNREYDLDIHMSAASEEELDEPLRRGLEAAYVVALNNLSDQTWWNGRYEARNRAVLAGMSAMPFTAHGDSGDPVILFVGNKTTSNIDGLKWFVETVWPTVRAEIPAARLRIVGRAAEGLDAAAGVELVGRVDALDAEYAAAQAVIVPLLQGSAGVKTKLVEGIAHGRAFVVTSAGIEPEHRLLLETGGYVADEPNVFAQSVLSLLNDREDRHAKESGTAVIYDALFSVQAAYREVDAWLEKGGT